MGIVIDIITMTLGILCMRNFGQGLQPFVQRGAANKQRLHDFELSKTKTNDTWVIDD
jgi:hypothetical protein